MVRIMFKIFSVILFSAILLAACTTKESTQQTVVTGNGFDKGSEWCSDFDLTAQEAQTFFDDAKELTSSEYHNKYEHIGCYVKGHTSYKNASCDFKIWAGATAELQCGDKEYLLGCSDCEFYSPEP